MRSRIFLIIILSGLFERLNGKKDTVTDCLDNLKGYLGNCFDFQSYLESKLIDEDDNWLNNRLDLSYDCHRMWLRLRDDLIANKQSDQNVEASWSRKSKFLFLSSHQCAKNRSLKLIKCSHFEFWKVSGH